MAAFDETFAKVNDYTVTIHEFEAKGDRTQNRTYDFWFKRPNFIKTQITAGDGKGSGAVWNGGDKISGHQAGLLSFIHLKVGLQDGRATILRGYTIPEGSMQAQVAKYKEIKGDLIERKGPAIDGVATNEVDLTYADPLSQGGA